MQLNLNARHRLFVAIGVLGLLMTGPFVLTALIIWLDVQADERNALIQLIVPRLPLGTVLTIFGFVLGVLVVRHLFRQYVEGLLRMGEHLRMMLGANRNFRVTVEGPPEVQELAQATNQLAAQRDALMDNVEAQVATAKASVEEEKNRLAALMSELAQAVVVCNKDGRVLLYNSRARLLFQGLQDGHKSGGASPIGLGRSIFSLLERGHVEHALAVIKARLAKDAALAFASFVLTAGRAQLLRVQIVPVLTPGTREMNGYVLTIENITRTLEQSFHRDQVLRGLLDGNRAALANMRLALGKLMTPETAAASSHELHVIHDEVNHMSQTLEHTAEELDDVLKARWPLEEVQGADVIVTAQSRIESLLNLPSKVEELDESLWIRSDSFSLVFAITFLAARLHEHYEIREVRFRLTPSENGKRAYLDVIWAGHAMSSETFYNWELDTMSVGQEESSLSLRDVVGRHGGQLVYEREKAAHRAFFRFVLPVATPEQWLHSRVATNQDSRPEYYDFDLFNFQAQSEIDLDCKLSDLSYTVFDTETTGLEPAGGDEIIQIGAVRIVNNRLLRQENFDQLVDPERPLRPEGIPIHGITEDMVRGQPNIDVVLPAFHGFCHETVLVAHNAAFDMRFLQLKEERTGLRFHQPVLDTLLLSAVIHPNQESHKLEKIAERLGVNIHGRHNAMGDAYATGEVFLKMVPLLAQQGIVTLRQALEASQKTYFARIKY